MTSHDDVRLHAPPPKHLTSDRGNRANFAGRPRLVFVVKSNHRDKPRARGVGEAVQCRGPCSAERSGVVGPWTTRHLAEVWSPGSQLTLTPVRPDQLTLMTVLGVG
jgi:hypothetical protein